MNPKEYYEKNPFLNNDKTFKQDKEKRENGLENIIYKNSFENSINKIDNNFKNKKENVNQSIKKARNPGIDFVRIISMYTVVFHHYLYFGDGIRHFPKYKRSFLIVHSFTGWHNNAFILISGIVGYKTNKYSNLLYLWLTVFFYSVGIHKYILHYKKNYVINENIFKEYYPIIFNRYWYFSSYFGMYLFLPVINKV